jgi:hypothetical protein
MSAGGRGDLAAAARRARAVAVLHARVTPELFGELCAAGGPPEGPAREAARREWDALSAFACVRALVAAFGFGSDGAETVDAFHDVVHVGTEGAAARAHAAARYEAYGAIVRAAGTDDPAAIAARLGAAVAGHMGTPALAELAGSLHEALYEAALEAARKEA